MRTWTGSGWTPAKSWNGVWWNNLARGVTHHLTTSAGTPAQANVGIPKQSWTMFVRLTPTTGTWGRFGGNAVGSSRFRFFGGALTFNLQAILGAGGSDGPTVQQTWTRTAENWAWVTYDGHILTSAYAGDVRVNPFPLTGFDYLPTVDGRVPLRVETAGAEALLIQQHLTTAEANSIVNSLV